MMLRVRHATAFRYAQEAESAAYLVRLCPRPLPWQAVHSFTLRALPGPALVSDGEDHLGNPVTQLFFEDAHERLELTSDLVVELHPLPAPPPPDSTPAWEVVAAKAGRPEAARSVAEFACSSGMPAVRAWAMASFPPGRPVLAGVEDLTQRMAREFRVASCRLECPVAVERVLQSGEGAPNDLAHLLIAGLRSLRLPARLVCGYKRGSGRPHAWVGCWLGPVLGWIDFDPMSGLVAGEDYVWLGWGRDYAQVSPVHGVQLGGGRASVSVSVDFEVLGAPPVGLTPACAGP